MRVETRLSRTLPVFGLSVSGQSNQRRSPAWLTPQYACNFVPVNVRQTYVYQDSVESVLTCKLYCVAAALGDHHRMPENFQQLTQALTQIVVVLDDQNPGHRAIL